MVKPAHRAIVFDLGKVLIDFNVERACKQVASVSNCTPDQVKSFLFDDGLEYQFEAGDFDFATLHEKFQDHFQTTIDDKALEVAASDIFTPKHATIKILTELHEIHAGSVPFVLLSNTNEIHWKHIEREWDLSKWFDHLILSFKVRSLKPDERIYQEVAVRTGAPLEQCFFVDDVLENVIGAKRVGLDAVVFEDAGQLRKELVTRGLLALS
jgi:FMN phosphatase YigB (HAD superfamily)